MAFVALLARVSFLVLCSGIEVRGLKDRVNVIVVSDHGMTNVNNQVRILRCSIHSFMFC